MSENEDTKPRKLTAQDLPELADDASSDDETFYCRHFVADGSSWTQTACSSGYSSENSCAADTPRRGDGPERSYSWTHKAC